MSDITLIRLLRRVWLPMCLSLTAMSVQAVANLGFPLLVKTMIDQVLPARRFTLLSLLCAAFAVLAALIVGLKFTSQYASRLAAEDVVLAIRQAVVRHAHLDTGHSPSREGNVGNQVALVAMDSHVLADLITGALPGAVFQGVRFLGALVVIAMLDWRLLVVAPITLGLFWIGPGLMRKRISGASEQARDAEAGVIAMASETIAGLLALRAAAGVHWAQFQLTTQFLTARRLRLRLTRLQLVGETGYMALWLVYAATYLYAGLQFFQGRISIGAVLAVGQLMGSLALPTQALGDLFTAYTASLGSVKRLREHLTVKEPRIFACALAPEFVAATGVLPLKAERLSLTQPNGVLAVRQVDLCVSRGEEVAVVGASGAGKSTLIQAIAGLRAPSSGRLTAGKLPFAAWPEAEFRRRVAVAFSEPVLFRGSLIENVALGRDKIDEDFVRHLLTLVRADELVKQGELLEGGRNLSTGQRQRIGLARALAADPDLLILDEATSGLDSESEARLFATIREHWPSLTLLVVSHRLATILQCRRVIVLDDGAVVDGGDPRELMNSGSRMAELIQAQVVAGA